MMSIKIPIAQKTMLMINKMSQASILQFVVKNIEPTNNRTPKNNIRYQPLDNDIPNPPSTTTS